MGLRFLYVLCILHCHKLNQAQKVKFQVLRPKHSFKVPASINVCALPNCPGVQELGLPFCRWKNRFKEEVVPKDHTRNELTVGTGAEISWPSPSGSFLCPRHYGWTFSSQSFLQRLLKNRSQSRPRSELSALNRVEVVVKTKGQRMVLTVWKPKKEFHRQDQNSFRELAERPIRH